jgi:surface carbohydrate biosynthesis protein
MSRSTVNILFPLETLVRELDYRLALAVKYLKPHHRIFLGRTPHTFRLLDQMQGGLYLGKHLFQDFKTPYGSSAYDLAKAKGFSVVHLSEEGAVFMGGDEYSRLELDRQLDPNTLSQDDYVATWGEFQAKHYLSKRPDWTDEHVRVTGHPRFDLYRPEYRALYDDRVRNIKQRFGNFVLINTNWLFALHPVGPEAIFTPVEGYHVEDDVKREWFVALWSRVARTVPAYIELIHNLSIRRKDLNFVFRPHPSDDPRLLRAAFKGVPNVHVIHEGHVVPWILASRLMMHDGCTTGMEAYLLGHPVVSYQPVPDEATNMQLTNLFGIRCTERKEAIDTVLAVANDPDKYAETIKQTHIPENAHQLFANFRHESFPRMLKLMSEAEERGGQSAASRNGGTTAGSVTPTLTRMTLDEAKETTIELAKRRLLRPFSKRRQAWARMTRVAYYGLQKEDVLPRLRVLERLENKRVNCRFYSENLIELTLG